MIVPATLEPVAATGRRDRTRQLICAAANRLFVAHGFTAPTIEEIAQAAGVRRSTLYNHFRDKDAILHAIADDYIESVRVMIAQLPGPVPTHAQVRVWIDAMRAFVIAQPAPAELIVAAGWSPDAVGVASRFGRDMREALAGRSEAFARALRQDAAFHRAWAESTLAELGAALAQVARLGDTVATRARLDVAAMLFARFVQDDR